MLTRLYYILYLSIIIILPSFTIAQVAAEELYRDDYDCEALYLDADTPDNPRIRNAIDFDNIDTKVIKVVLHTFEGSTIGAEASESDFNDGIDDLNAIFEDSKIQFINAGYNVYEVDEIVECRSYNSTECGNSTYCTWESSYEGTSKCFAS